MKGTTAYRDNAEQARDASVSLLASAAVATVAALLDVLRTFQAFWMASNEASPQDLPIVLSGVLRGLVSWVQVGLLLVTAVFFLRWFHRAYANLQPLDGLPPDFGTGWAIGTWFVPVVNWLLPLLIAREIWLRSHRAAAANAVDPVPASTWLVAGWWLLCLAATVLSACSGDFRPPLNHVAILSFDLCWMGGALTARVMVRRVQEAQQSAAARVTGLTAFDRHPRRR